MDHSPKDGFNNVKYPYAHGIENMYFMLYRKHFPLEEYKNSTQKDEYVYLYEKVDEMKSDNITFEDEGIVEYGNDFINCKFIHDRDST